MNRTFRFALSTAAALAVVTMGTVQAQSMSGKAAPTLPARAMDGSTAQPKSANEFRPFSKEAFNVAAAEGKTTLVFFHAPWCPVCKAQEPKLQAHLNGDARHVVPFKVDYDSNQALRDEMRVAKQSTVILFQGAKEVARVSYKSDDASIDELFKHASMSMMSDGR